MRELIEVLEQWDFCDQENQFVKATNFAWKEGDDYYILSLPGRQTSFDLHNVARPNPIPWGMIYGQWDDSLTEYSHPLSTDTIYVKLPNVAQYVEGEPGIGGRLVVEAKIYELLRQHPHRNICPYYGCVRKGVYLTGICLKRFKFTSYDAVLRTSVGFDRDRVVDGIRDGLNFLHSLGLIHNDLNPRNIMIDDEGIPVIIDFDLCEHEGVFLGEGTGTIHWSQNANTSIPENDFYSLGLIEKFINGEYRNDKPGSTLTSIFKSAISDPADTLSSIEAGKQDHSGNEPGTTNTTMVAVNAVVSTGLASRLPVSLEAGASV